MTLEIFPTVEVFKDVVLVVGNKLDNAGELSENKSAVDAF
jgi:hypothetical protein